MAWYTSRMSLRTFVLAMVGATVLAWIAWGSILTGVDPVESGLPGILLFYVTLSVASAGTVSLLLAFIRLKVLKRHDVPSREVHIAFRHAVLFTFVLIVSLLLSARGGVHTWQLVALVALVVLAEQFFARSGRG